MPVSVQIVTMAVKTVAKGVVGKASERDMVGRQILGSKHDLRCRSLIFCESVVEKAVWMGFDLPVKESLVCCQSVRIIGNSVL